MARSRRGLLLVALAASRKIHSGHVLERNVTKKFVRTKMQTPILAADERIVSVDHQFFTRALPR